MEKLDHLFNLIEFSFKQQYFGEKISQYEHAVQCAWQAEKEGWDEAIVLGAFFHDIGHLLEVDEMNGLGAIYHDKIGADYIRSLGFPEITAAMIENHVEAKRYLCWKNKAYLRSLSPASLRTLDFQGGPMNNEEASRFESLPDYQLFLRMRRWDELAKEENVAMPSLDKFKLICLRVLEG